MRVGGSHMTQLRSDPHAQFAEHPLAPAVVNVALNDSFTGGDLLYAVGGRLERPMRAAGVATAHDGATVHGVTALTAGVRYTLLVAFGQ